MPLGAAAAATAAELGMPMLEGTMPAPMPMATLGTMLGLTLGIMPMLLGTMPLGTIPMLLGTMPFGIMPPMAMLFGIMPPPMLLGMMPPAATMGVVIMLPPMLLPGFGIIIIMPPPPAALVGMKPAGVLLLMSPVLTSPASGSSSTSGSSVQQNTQPGHRQEVKGLLQREQAGWVLLQQGCWKLLAEPDCEECCPLSCAQRQLLPLRLLLRHTCRDKMLQNCWLL
jgi:hypothetical protein